MLFGDMLPALPLPLLCWLLCCLMAFTPFAVTPPTLPMKLLLSAGFHAFVEHLHRIVTHRLPTLLSFSVGCHPNADMPEHKTK